MALDGLQTVLAGSGCGELLGLADSMLASKIDIKDIRVDGSNVHIDFEADGGGDITFRYGNTNYILDCTTGDGPGGIATVILEQGTDEEPVFQFIHMFYSENSGKVEVATSQIIPTDGQFGPVCYCLCPTATRVAESGTIFIHRISDVMSDGIRGALSHAREKLRLGTAGNNRIVGCDVELEIVTNGASRDSIYVTSLAGLFYQLHKHTWAGYYSATYDIRSMGQKIGACLIPNYSMVTDLGTITQTSQGETIVDGDSIFIDIKGIGTSCSCKKLGFAVSKHKYSTAAECITAAEAYGAIPVPKEVRHLTFTLARIVLTYSDANGGTWTNALSSTTDVWRSVAATTATPNYPANYPNGYSDYIGPTLTFPGATTVRVHFSAFNTERNWDYLQLRNAAGDIITRYHGNSGDFTSIEIAGDTIRPYFQSDGSINRSGCYIDKFEYKLEVTSGGGEIIDMR